MAPSEYFTALFTKRGIVAVIAIVALLGAGVGSLPSSTSDFQNDSGDAALRTTDTTAVSTPTETPTHTTATTTELEPTTERALSGETSSETRTVRSETTTTKGAPETTDSAPEVTWDTADAGRSNGQPEATVRAEGNATVGSLPANPSAVAR